MSAIVRPSGVRCDAAPTNLAGQLREVALVVEPRTIGAVEAAAGCG
jgi:hypothetical protein